MIEIDRAQGQVILPLFDGMGDTLILSYAQGHMGRGWADGAERPTCAQILVGAFCFLAGDPRAEDAAALAGNIPPGYQSPWGNVLIIPQNGEWGALIEGAWPDHEKCVRAAIKKEPDCFDRARLRSFAEALPEGYDLSPIGGKVYEETKKHEFSADFCSQFATAEEYQARGLGYCVLCNGELVGGASSYTVYDGGIEIEIAVKEEHRRKGLAAACAAKLILECLDRGLYPSWDAANNESVALAEKLGYHFSHAYDAYSVDLPDGKAEMP